MACERKRRVVPQKYDTKLGFMSFFVKRASMPYTSSPPLTPRFARTTIVYHNYCDIGVPSAAERLVRAVLHNQSRLSFA